MSWSILACLIVCVFLCFLFFHVFNILIISKCLTYFLCFFTILMFSSFPNEKSCLNCVFENPDHLISSSDFFETLYNFCPFHVPISPNHFKVLPTSSDPCINPVLFDLPPIWKLRPLNKSCRPLFLCCIVYTMMVKLKQCAIFESVVSFHVIWYRVHPVPVP